MNDYNQEIVNFVCPYCGENIAVIIDYSAGEQTYYEDCSVCCAPILFKLSESINGDLTLTIQRDNE